MYKDSEREAEFPLAVSVSYQNGDRGKQGDQEERCGHPRRVRPGRGLRPALSELQHSPRTTVETDCTAAFHCSRRSTENYLTTAVRLFDLAGFNMAAKLSLGKYRLCHCVRPRLIH